jgi:predicted metal-dependent peptidase
MTNMTPQQRIERAHATIVRTPELAVYSSLVMLGEAKLDPTCPTACTDGRNIYYGTEFIQTLTDGEMVFVAMHEALHIGFRHLITWDKLYREDAQLANAACDYVINLMLHDLSKQTDKLKFPMRDGKLFGLLDEKYRGMSAGEVYKLLKEEDEEQEQQKPKQQPGQPGEGQTPLRKHIQDNQFDEHDFDAAAEMDDKEKEELSDTVDRAMRQGIAAAEKMGATTPRELKELLTPKVDWREVLADFVCNAVRKDPEQATFRKYNRRTIGMSDYDVFMPSYFDDRIAKVVVAVDLSGSVYHLAEKFVAEVVNVCTVVQPEELHLLYWDTSVQGHEVYAPDQYEMIAQTTKPAGGGGTDVRCVPKHMHDNDLTDADCVIVLTDGEFFYGQGNWGSTPVLWCVIEPYDKAFTPVVGSKVAVKI